MKTLKKLTYNIKKHKYLIITITIPPFLGNNLRISFGTLRGLGQREKAEE